MGTLTISAGSFAALPVNPPADWPTNLTWPAGANVNGAKSYTISDADWVKLLSWAADVNNAQIISGLSGPPYAPTGVQILLSLVQNWINGMIMSQQVHATIPAQLPPPVVIQ